MYRRRSFGIVASFMALAFFGAAHAADPAHRPDPAKVTPTATFVQEAVAGNLFEVESSKLALDRSQNAAIKTFAKHMIDDHSAAGVKLAEAVNQAKLARPPLKLDARHQAIIEDLAGRKGADFDQVYVDVQHKAHIEAVALFESYSATGEDGQLKALAGQLLPTLKGHLAQIDKIANSRK
jgi:putative membrane protein